MINKLLENEDRAKDRRNLVDELKISLCTT